MLTITLIALMLVIPLASTAIPSAQMIGQEKVRKATISATLFTRIVAIALLFAAALSYNGFSSMNHDYSNTLESLDAGVGLYSGLIHATTVTQSMEVFLLVSGILVLLPWGPNGTHALLARDSYAHPTIPEYPILILFTTMGATFLLASADLVSMYLSIELQSFGLYILAAVYRDSESATAAGLKYFLLGALSSALILLGSALIYSYTGLTNLNSIYELISVPSNTGDSETQIVVLGIMIMSVGLLFKVASAPFHYWAPDVYDGTPTIVTTWLTVMPKISIFLFLLELYIGTNATLTTSFMTVEISSHLLLICAFLSLVIGTVVGLGQYRIKRLLAYSTISHVGFLLLALAVASATLTGASSDPFIGQGSEESVEAFLFYMIQYTATNINVFFILLGFGYLMNKTREGSFTSDIQFTSELQGQFGSNPVLGLSLAICLFSMAGIPPLVGFFAKYTILYSAINNGYVFLAIVAILASVVSAVYYLRVIRVIYFSPLSLPLVQTSLKKEGLKPLSPLEGGGQGGNLQSPELSISNADVHTETLTGEITYVHSYVIASLTLAITLFAVNPTLILNSTSIMALSLYCR